MQTEKYLQIPWKDIQKYIDEFVFRYNTGNNNEAAGFNVLLQNIENRIFIKP
jgi:hypothetical protein